LNWPHFDLRAAASAAGGPCWSRGGPPAFHCIGRGNDLLLEPGPEGDRGWLAVVSRLDPGPRHPPWERLRAIARRLRPLLRHEGPLPDGRRFPGGFAGAIAWEAGRYFDAALDTPPGGNPWDFVFGFWDRVEAGGEGTVTLDLLSVPGTEAAADPGPFAPPDCGGPALFLADPRPDLDAESHHRAVDTIRERIADGIVYQANLTLRLRGVARGVEAAWATWSRLLRDNPAPCAAWMRLPGVVVVGASPEVFLTVDGQGRVLSRPIKGTRPRSPGVPQPTDPARQDLEGSAKDAAELAMIIDLVRNDLSRCCEGVTRTANVVTEAHPTVWHRVGEVEGRLQPGRDIWDLLPATFPPGSCVGAPKIRAALLLRELERSPRFLYTGALGWLGWDGTASFSVTIRTLTVQDGQAELGVGGGIVWDSEPGAEWMEAMAKARALLDAARPGPPLGQRIFKIVRAHERDAWLREGAWLGSEADRRDGFVHLSSGAQVPGTLARHFAGEGPLWLAEIDPALVSGALRWEPSRGGALFPHLHGALPRTAVRAERLVRAEDLSAPPIADEAEAPATRA
jgi:para-aminobenzoate synthetase component 1